MGGVRPSVRQGWRHTRRMANPAVRRYGVAPFECADSLTLSLSFSPRRTVRELLGYHVAVAVGRGLSPGPATLQPLIDGTIIAAWLGLKLARGCKACTINGQLTHVKLMLPYFEEGAPPAEVAELQALAQQLGNVGRQLVAVEPRVAREGPEQLRLRRRWCTWIELQQAVWLYTRKLLIELSALAATRRAAMRREAGARRPVCVPTMDSELAFRVNDAMMLVLMVVLPPHRSRLFRTLHLRGCCGIPDDGTDCPECPDGRQSTCGGNVLVRKGKHRFFLLITHHKTAQRPIGPLELSAATSVPEEALELLEVVFAFGQRALVDALGVEGAAGTRAFRRLAGAHLGLAYGEDSHGCATMSKRIRQSLTNVLRTVPALAGTVLTHKQLRNMYIHHAR